MRAAQFGLCPDDGSKSLPKKECDAINHTYSIGCEKIVAKETSSSSGAGSIGMGFYHVNVRAFVSSSFENRYKGNV